MRNDTGGQRTLRELFNLVDIKRDRRYKFNFFEQRRIRREVMAQVGEMPSLQPFITVDGVALPSPGHIFRLKEGTRYIFFAPGSYVLVTETFIYKETLKDPRLSKEVLVIALNSEGRLVDDRRQYDVRAEDIEPVSEKALEDVLKSRLVPLPQEDIFRDGEAVELKENVVWKAESPMGGAVFQTFPKGLRGIIDRPNSIRGSSLSEINSPYQLEYKKDILIKVSLISGDSIAPLKVGVLEVPLSRTGQGYDVYLPNYKINYRFGSSQLQRRQFDKGMFSRVVMDDATRQQILSLVSGGEEMLSRWGIEKFFQAGIGRVFLAFGPPGTGKTMTGEALAELLERPLYIADSTKLIPSPGHFEEALRDVIEKTERWNSVTIIDEAEGMLLSRENTPYDVSWRIEAVLRNLEKLKRGILWLTTNRPIDIDPAINSRIRSQFHFARLDADKRRKVWEVTFPKDLPISGLTGQLLDRLAEIDINGREIRNAIINAAERASYEKLESVPGEYVLAAAKTIWKNQEILDNAKKNHNNHRGGRHIGFLK